MMSEKLANEKNKNRVEKCKVEGRELERQFSLGGEVGRPVSDKCFYDNTINIGVINHK